MPTKTQLIKSIESYATAKSTGDIDLIQFAASKLKELLDQLPEQLLPEPSESPTP